MVDVLGVVAAERSFAEHEHREMSGGVDEMEAVAQASGSMTASELVRAVRRIRSWIGAVLVPHTSWEDAVLYAEIDDRARTTWATRLMRYEHQQILRAAGRLERDIELVDGQLMKEQAGRVRDDLVTLATLLHAHIERENLFLLPLLGEAKPRSDAALRGA